MLTYILFKTQNMLLSATGSKCQPDHDLQSVQNPEHSLVSNKEEGPARFLLTPCSKPRTCSSQQQAGRASKMLTHTLLKAQSMILSATNMKGWPDADLHPVKPRACSCQQHAGRASQILTYMLFKTQSMLLSATSKNVQPTADLHPVQNPDNAHVSNKQEHPARC